MTPPVPTVSVVVPNYNHADSLRLTLPALLAQTHPATEIVFVDDRSTDDSVAVARALGVPVLSTPRNGGPALARNLGAAHATGEVLLFVDSDVELPPDTVARAVALLAADPAAGAVCGTLDEVPLVRDSLVQECRCLQAHWWRISSLGDVSFLFTAICAMPARVFAEIGPFHEGLRQTEEVEYGERMGARYPIRLTDAIHGRHRDDDRLWPMLRKVFHRSRLRMPLYVRRRRAAQGFETAARMWASVTALLATAVLPLPLLLGPAGALPSAALAVAFLACDAGMYRFVLRRRGAGLLVAFVGVQWLINLAIVAGAAAGAAQWLFSRSFRALYEGGPQPAAVPA
ncbi:Poly-beta-1,6-N-acetyl-D-glucosamine synthase [Micromonospora sp. MW-13]|uniref:glycosyltransferase family 2 protein n=1 Tax=Micromonospora sp. MW-13 TaxID=2094022 RepID=UPI000E442B38|nr:glycosyltransferase family 2 protein [Micromonospora sp. MW-13]RGC65956.1 Poly-beta-1,6-N-acetyl-D-glucosamine synthase [Micromonospora sp. MW-13]